MLMFADGRQQPRIKSRASLYSGVGLTSFSLTCCRPTDVYQAVAGGAVAAEHDSKDIRLFEKNNGTCYLMNRAGADSAVRSCSMGKSRYIHACIIVGVPVFSFQPSAMTV